MPYDAQSVETPAVSAAAFSSVARASLLVAVLSASALVAALARDMTIAAVFGIGRETDAFLVGTLLPTSVATLAATGVLNVIVIPTLSRLARVGKEAADTFAANFILLFAALLIGVAAGGVYLSPTVVHVIVPGLDSQTSAVAIELQRIALPMIPVVGVASVMTAMLNARGSFGVAALARFIGSVAAWVAVGILGLKWGIRAATWGVLGASMLQLAIQLPLVLAQFRLRPHWPIIDRSLVDSSFLALPVVVGLAAGEISQWVLRGLASTISVGAITELTYAVRIYAVPLTVIAGSLTQVILPRFASQLAAHDHEGAAETMRSAIEALALVTLPAAVLLAVLSFDISGLLFGLRQLPVETTDAIARCLIALSPSLPVAAVDWLLITRLYAAGRSKPALLSWIVFGIAMLAAAFLGRPFGVAAIAFATFVATCCQTFVLYLALPDLSGTWQGVETLRRYSPVILAVVAMSVSVLASIAIPVMSLSLTARSAIHIAVGIPIGVIVYAWTLRWRYRSELTRLLQPLIGSKLTRFFLSVDQTHCKRKY